MSHIGDNEGHVIMQKLFGFYNFDVCMYYNFI